MLDGAKEAVESTSADGGGVSFRGSGLALFGSEPVLLRHQQPVSDRTLLMQYHQYAAAQLQKQQLCQIDEHHYQQFKQYCDFQDFQDFQEHRRQQRRHEADVAELNRMVTIAGQQVEEARAELRAAKRRAADAEAAARRADAARQSAEDVMLCVVCMSERRECVPRCDHLCMCKSCATRMTKCPICRRKFRSVRHVHWC